MTRTDQFAEVDAIGRRARELSVGRNCAKHRTRYAFVGEAVT